MQTTFKIDLHLTAYKINLTQEWKLNDYGVEYYVSFQIRRSSFGAYVNKQNCRILSKKNSALLYGFWSSGVIGPYFSSNEAGDAITINESVNLDNR